ncbi:MAG: sulfatase [Planctomycetaceae bacterium]|nr:sulfatase [Planctomycetaceae bacterium]
MLLSALSLVCLSGSLSAADARAQNVLFIVADDLNCDLHCYGHPQVKSPNIDRLAARGVQFNHAYCQYPLCSPSRTSFLTGRRPNRTQIHRNARSFTRGKENTASPHFREFIPDTVTLPELFRKNDYFVARVGKLYHYGVPLEIGTVGLDDAQSWDFVVNPAGRDKAEENKVFSLVPGSYGGTLSWLASDGTDAEQTDGLAATAAISLMEEHKDEPFFLAVGFYRPHTPYVAPKGYFANYPAKGITLPELSEDDQNREPKAAYLSSKKDQENMSDDLRREAIQAYWASIEFMDAQVGRVVAALDDLGLADNTVVVMISDHGYHMYEHGLWQKMSLFENSARVPMIVAAPDAKGNGTATDSLAELVDLYPTLAELCGLAVPDYLDGVSQVGVLDNPAAKARDVALTQVKRGSDDGYSLRTATYRYTMWKNAEDGEQLYDMTQDPGELRNLASDPKFATQIQEFRRIITTEAAR